MTYEEARYLYEKTHFYEFALEVKRLGEANNLLKMRSMPTPKQEDNLS